MLNKKVELFILIAYGLQTCIKVLPVVRDYVEIYRMRKAEERANDIKKRCKEITL